MAAIPKKPDMKNLQIVEEMNAPCAILSCKHEETEQRKMWGPLIAITKQVRDSSFHKSYFNLMQSATFTCPICPFI